jgi:hypothetical protein
VGEGDGLTGAPILVIDGCAVFGGDGGHMGFLLTDDSAMEPRSWILCAGKRFWKIVG